MSTLESLQGLAKTVDMVVERNEHRCYEIKLKGSTAIIAGYYKEDEVEAFLDGVIYAGFRRINE